MNNAMIAIDIGASSGRHMLGQVKNGRLELTELYRFSNGRSEKTGVYAGISTGCLPKF